MKVDSDKFREEQFQKLSELDPVQISAPSSEDNEPTKESETKSKKS